jgi:hypothetical protein
MGGQGGGPALPKKVREEAHIGVSSRLVARAKGEGQVEIFDPELLMKRAQAIGARKLAGWREEGHEATELLSKLAKEHADA